MDRFERLQIRPGDEVRAEHLLALEKALDAQEVLAGPGVFPTVTPFGTVLEYRGGGGGYVSPYFAPSASIVTEGVEVRFAKGLIAGIEPQIDGKAISAPDGESGSTPALLIPEASFNALGESRVFFRLNITRDWEIQSIGVVASPEYLPDEAWVTHKLAAVVYRDATVWRQLVANQSWLAVSRRSTGRALHLFFARY